MACVWYAPAAPPSISMLRGAPYLLAHVHCDVWEADSCEVMAQSACAENQITKSSSRYLTSLFCKLVACNKSGGETITLSISISKMASLMPSPSSWPSSNDSGGGTHRDGLRSEHYYWPVKSSSTSTQKWAGGDRSDMCEATRPHHAHRRLPAEKLGTFTISSIK